MGEMIQERNPQTYPQVVDRRQRLVRVALPVPLYRVFDYRLDEAQAAAPGAQVQVPFGRRQLWGVVLELPEQAAIDVPLKSVLKVAEDSFRLPEVDMALCQWLARYYHQPLGEVFAAAVPAGIRRLKPLREGPARWQITEAGRAIIDALPANARKQRQILSALAASSAQTAAELEADAAALRRLHERGWVEAVVVDEAPALPVDIQAGVALNEAQRDVLQQWLDAGGGFRVALLRGVTGSGKTEVYLELAARALTAGGQVLVMVPEIALTPQLLGRFRQRFGDRVLAYHSGLGDGERARVWMQCRRGDPCVVVGTRSSVFLPMPGLAQVVVDEEHDASYKQQDGLPYSGRDVAIYKSRLAGAGIMLGTATPSLESLENAASGRYQLLELTRRAHGGKPPRPVIVDIRGRALFHGLSHTLLERVDLHLARGGQVLLFVNRRGYAPNLLCHDCGWSCTCPHCSAKPTLHRRQQLLICHHCGSTAAMPHECPSCGSSSLIALGQGTERIEEALAERYPGVGLARMDSESARSASGLEDVLARIRSGEARLIVGTQMLAKGHDFPQISLVGVVNVDQSLFSADLRAVERMGQLVMQVAGRAGRGERRGEVLLQTHEPEHPLLRCLVEEGYQAFSQQLLEERHTLGLPPIAHWAVLRSDALEASESVDLLREAASLLPDNEGCEVLGPMPALMERRGGRWRFVLLLQHLSRPALQSVLSRWIPAVAALPSARRVRWSIDVDPAEL